MRYLKIPSSILTVVLVALLVACSRDFPETNVSFKQYQVEPGFSLEAIIAEPLIEAPVDISFDDRGRLWILEMPGYMRSLEGIREDAPIGRIVVAQDRDRDGQADHAVVFLDSLKLARAFSHVYGGLLYAEPPNLWFVEINEDLTPGKRTLVDDAYAVGGNVEHQPNGLLMNIDNWIYNAKSTKRYRRRNGQWQTETTSFRGQWGISRDEVGRLLYNNNSNQLQGDWALPNVLNQKPAFRSPWGISTTIVRDQRVYPVQATAVNRGYIDGMLHPDGKLRNFTSACGPLFYQGQNFPAEYYSNAFVCAPEVNLIKRNIIDHRQLRSGGVQAWQDKEFIISSDEGFRPVNLQNGPDGAMYIVDMHRGIIQHKTYMTSYLRQKYIEKGLDSLVGMGRVIRVVHESGGTPQVPDLTSVPVRALVDSLASTNIWIRDRAQQMIITSDNEDLVEPVVSMLQNAENGITRLHALYALEGMGVLNKSHMSVPEMASYPWLMGHVLRLISQSEIRITTSAIEQLLNLENEVIDYYMAYYLANVFSESLAPYVSILLNRYEQEDWFLGPFVSGFKGDVEVFRNATNGFGKTLEALEKAMEPTVQTTTGTISSDGLTRGLTLYRQHCATCHGADGTGLSDLAPPLLRSEYVSGVPERLVAIILYGLQGPITVNGQSYDFLTPMPGLKVNEKISNAEIRDIANYVRNGFTTSPQSVSKEMVAAIRDKERASSALYDVEELNSEYEK